MKSLIHFDEFGKNMGFPSMKDYFCDKPYKGIDKIISYLQKGEVTYVSASQNRDVFTNERFNGSLCGMTDGVYSWTNALWYYVKKYNLKLNEEFTKYVLSQS